MQRQVRNIYLPVWSDQLIFVFGFRFSAVFPLSFWLLICMRFLCVCLRRSVPRFGDVGLPCCHRLQCSSPSPARCVPFETVLKSTNCLSNTPHSAHSLATVHSPPSRWRSVRQSVNCQAKSIAQLRFDLVLRTVRSFGKSSQILDCIHVQLHSVMHGA